LGGVAYLLSISYYMYVNSYYFDFFLLVSHENCVGFAISPIDTKKSSPEQKALDKRAYVFPSKF